MTETFWRRCSTCKGDIGFSASYWVCSVSTCNRKQNAFVFCSMPCFDVHLPMFRHREAWAEEQRAPSASEWQAASARAAQPAPGASVAAHSAAAARPEAATGSRDDGRPTRRIIVDGGASTEAPRSVGGDADLSDTDIPRDILIVASKLKNYVRARSGLNTSDGVMDALSDEVRALCDAAIRRAREAGRKTLLDRDF